MFGIYDNFIVGIICLILGIVLLKYKDFFIKYGYASHTLKKPTKNLMIFVGYLMLIQGVLFTLLGIYKLIF